MSELELPCEREVGLVRERMLELRPRIPGIPDEWVREFLTEGKFVRSRMLLLSYYATGGEVVDQDVVDAAASIELIHCASLVHDDIVDDAETRRGLLSAPVLIGDRLSLLLGDALFTESFWLSSRLGREVATLARDGVREMVIGEAREIVHEDPEWDPDDAQEVAREKTASVMSAACAVGAVLAGGDQDVVDRLGRFGLLLGQAFQAVDDALDLSGEGEAIGKPQGIDQRIGAPNLARALGDAGAEEARKLAETWVHEAYDLLEDLPGDEARQELEGLAAFITTRRR